MSFGGHSPKRVRSPSAESEANARDEGRRTPQWPWWNETMRAAYNYMRRMHVAVILRQKGGRGGGERRDDVEMAKITDQLRRSKKKKNVQKGDDSWRRGSGEFWRNFETLLSDESSWCRSREVVLDCSRWFVHRGTNHQKFIMTVLSCEGECGERVGVWEKISIEENIAFDAIIFLFDPY